MRILYIDIDSMRPDHLGCYGYHRNTSPNIDLLAADGAIVRNLYASDTPCLPSRTGFFGGRFGTQTGVVNHGGVCADLPIQGRSRDFRSDAANRSLASILTRCGYWTASISPFPRRHSAYQMVYGFHETIDTGRGGLENAEEIFAEVERWLNGRGKQNNWFLHVNMWDPHTPYDTPVEFGNPFEGDPIDPWLVPDVLEKQRESYGPHSAREVPDYDSNMNPKFWPWGRGEIASLDDAKIHIDGYDCGVRYADQYVGRIMNILADLQIDEETIVIVAADHGENLGELNIWGDHQTADEFTNHIPGVIRIPGSAFKNHVIEGFHYHLDLAATILDIASDKGRDEMVQWNWQGRPFVLRGDALASDRERLFLSQGAWSLQRSMRWDDWLLIHTQHTGIKDFSEWMLYDLKKDPHETTNVAAANTELVKEQGRYLQEEFARMASECCLGDPFKVVADEGGPLHARVHGYNWIPYLQRLRETGRAHHADWLERNGSAPRPPELAAY